MYKKRDEITYAQFEHYADLINNILDLNMFKNTRKIEYAYARYLLAHLIKNKFPQTTFTTIARFYIKKGKSSHHSTIMHSISTWKNLIDPQTKWTEKSQRQILNGYTVEYILNELELDYVSELADVLKDVRNLTKKGIDILKPCIDIAKKV